MLCYKIPIKWYEFAYYELYTESTVLINNTEVYVCCKIILNIFMLSSFTTSSDERRHTLIRLHFRVNDSSVYFFVMPLLIKTILTLYRYWGNFLCVVCKLDNNNECCVSLNV